MTRLPLRANCTLRRIRSQSGAYPVLERRRHHGSYNAQGEDPPREGNVQAELDYVGSITIDEDLMDAAGILEYEKVQIVDIDNGSRFETYTIAGEAEGKRYDLPERRGRPLRERRRSRRYHGLRVDDTGRGEVTPSEGCARRRGK